MLTLFHHPLCPFSRFARLAITESGLTADLVEERPWDRRVEFLTLNPAGTTPVLVEDGAPPVPDARIIAEYLDETRGADLGEHRLLPREIGARIEVRRLCGWLRLLRHAARFESEQQCGAGDETRALPHT